MIEDAAARSPQLGIRVPGGHGVSRPDDHHHLRQVGDLLKVHAVLTDGGRTSMGVASTVTAER